MFVKAVPKHICVTLRVLSVGVVAIYCLAGFSAHYERVLCIGEDGHRQIEYASRGFCAEPQSASQNASATFDSFSSATSRQEHCGSCVDFPIVTTPFGFQAVVRSVASEFSSHTGNIYLFPEPGSANGAALPKSHPITLSHSSSAARSLRATVLLI